MPQFKVKFAIAGAILTGGATMLLLLGAGSAFAASPTPVGTAAVIATATPTTTTTDNVQPAATTAPSAAASGAPGSSAAPVNHTPFGRNEAVSDDSVVAFAIGISVADLDAALAKGQTVAAIAKAHNVDPQKVIDALVTDGLNELAAEVKAGTITQAQADAQKAAVTQRATDQVNGTFSGGPGGPGGPGCPGGATH
jgi:hypothetical protein